MHYTDARFTIHLQGGKFDASERFGQGQRAFSKADGQRWNDDLVAKARELKDRYISEAGEPDSASFSARMGEGESGADNAGAGRVSRTDEYVKGYHPGQQPVGRERIREVLSVRDDGRIVLEHYSRTANDILSTHYAGSGIEGAEKKKRERLGPDVYMNLLYFAIPGRYAMEEALRSLPWRHDVSVPVDRMYDWKNASKDGLIEEAVKRSMAGNRGLYDEAHVEWTANRMLRDAGYWGLYNSLEHGQQAIGLLWHSVTPEAITHRTTGETRKLEGKSRVVPESEAPRPAKADFKPATPGAEFDSNNPAHTGAVASQLYKVGLVDLSKRVGSEGFNYDNPAVKKAIERAGFKQAEDGVSFSTGPIKDRDHRELSSPYLHQMEVGFKAISQEDGI